jgi:hypothetical protein
MNSLDSSQCNGELSQENISEYVQLVEFLRSAGDESLSLKWTRPEITPARAADVLASTAFRYAPSIITRSEAELLGLADPRFAIRARIKGGVGLINLRRVDRFRLNCESVHFVPKGPVWPGKSIEDAEAGGKWRPVVDSRPIQVIGSGISCIADSVLHANERLHSLYHVVERDFTAAYGESSPLIGTAYVKHISFQGGGLCAQAACFTVAAMMQQFLPAHRSGRFESGVHGIAEITAIAARREQSDLHLTGLTYEMISKYLENIGLSAPRQALHNYHLMWAGSANKLQAELFESVARAYAISGFPIIVPTVARLLPWRKQHDPGEPVLNHAVVIVGCGRDQTPAGHRLLVNDPSYMPFLEADYADIANAAAPNALKRTATIVAAVPSDVVLPLWGMRRSHVTFPGLFEISRFIQTLKGVKESGQLCKARYRVKPEDWRPGAFQLVRFGTAFDPFGPSALRVVPAATVWRIIHHANAKGLIGWHWVQYRKTPGGQCFAIWNAQRSGSDWQITFPKDSAEHVEFMFLSQMDKLRSLLVVEEGIT